MSKTVKENVKYQHSAIVLFVFYFKRRKQNLLLCKTGSRVVHLLILDKIFKIEKQTLVFVFVN